MHAPASCRRAARTAAAGVFSATWPAILLTFGGWIGPAPPRAQAQPPAPALFAAQLASGEFAPAIAAAKRLDSPAERDDRLTQVAAAMARAGDRDTALTTLAELSDDRRRASAVETVRQIAPAGAAGG